MRTDIKNLYEHKNKLLIFKDLIYQTRSDSSGGSIGGGIFSKFLAYI